jgi:hypothetical protein
MYFDHYTGFEGHEEITFKAADGSYIASLWGGYFDFIIDKTVPNQQGCWESLALFYHTHTGWYSNSPFELIEVAEAYHQLLACSSESWSAGTLAAHNDLLAVFRYAASKGLSIIIEYF